MIKSEYLLKSFRQHIFSLPIIANAFKMNTGAFYPRKGENMSINDIALKGIKLKQKLRGVISSKANIDKQLGKLEEMKESFLKSQHLHESQITNLDMEYKEWRIQAKRNFQQENFSKDWSLAELERQFQEQVESLVDPKHE